MSFFALEKASSKYISPVQRYQHSQSGVLQKHLWIDGRRGFPATPYETFKHKVSTYGRSFSRPNCASYRETTERRVFPWRKKRPTRYNWCPIEASDYSTNDERDAHSEAELKDKTSRYREVREERSACSNVSRSRSYEGAFDAPICNECADGMEEECEHSLLSKFIQVVNDHQSRTKSLPSSIYPRQGYCECKLHIGNHDDCCHCQKPYQWDKCRCVEHDELHSRCCRCSPRLLKYYEAFLRKKKYLRINPCKEHSLVSDFISTSEHLERQDRTIKAPQSPSQRESSVDEGNHSQNSNVVSPKTCNTFSSGVSPEQGDNTIREIHSMLTTISKSLKTPSDCCSLNNFIKDYTTKIRTPLSAERALLPKRKALLNNSRPRVLLRKVPPPTPPSTRDCCDAAIQVDSSIVSQELPSKKKSFKKKLRKMCVVS